MSKIIYPKRQRCKTCSKKLDKIVLQGLYCSYKCGKLPEPFTKVADAPRPCKLERDGTWIWKQKYRCLEEVPDRLQNDPSTNVYTCNHCFFLHVGHSRATGKETARLIRDNETLGSVLERIREERKETRKDVAAKLKIRPIRIKEIEEGAQNIDTKVLFALLNHYRIKMNILF